MAFQFNETKRWIAVLLAAGAVTTVAVTTITGTTGTFTGTVQAEQLTSTDDGTITDDLYVGGTVTADGGITVSNGDLAVSAGDLSATGGYRQQVGPFTDTLAASQTDTVLVYGIATHGFISQRAGSVVGVSCQLSAAITGSSTTVDVEVAINGTPVAATAIQFTQAGAETELSSTFAKGTHALAADDVVTVVYTSTGISNTPTIVCQAEIEQ